MFTLQPRPAPAGASPSRWASTRAAATRSPTSRIARCAVGRGRSRLRRTGRRVGARASGPSTN